MDKLREQVRLHRMGLGARQMARTLRISPNTERAYRERLRAAGLYDGDPADLPDRDVLARCFAVARKRPPQE